MNTTPQTNTTPHLKRRAGFEAVLADYRVSDRARGVLDKLTLVLLSGATASGRNTVIDRLVQTGSYRFIVSDTTRPPRVNNGIPEQSGREYWFRSEEDVLEDLRQGEFLEAEIIHKEQVSGISMRELEKALAEHKIAIDEVEIGGFQRVAHEHPATVSIILLPPSFEEWQRRLTKRGQMAPSEFKNRMETAVRVFTEAASGNFATLVINETVEKAAQDIDHIVRTGDIDSVQQQQARDLSRQLLVQTQELLETL